MQRNLRFGFDGIYSPIGGKAATVCAGWRSADVRPKRWWAAALALLLAMAMPARAAQDPRAQAHGISLVRVSQDQYRLIWSDSYGQAQVGGAWQHDIYWQAVDAQRPRLMPKRLLYARPEAQEPASAAVAGDGTVLVTFEDGFDADEATLAQRCLLRDRAMGEHKADAATVGLGGHSGHAAATREKLIIFWNEGWVEGGGADNLGTGETVLVTAMDTDGGNASTRRVSPLQGARDWWPLAAASAGTALLVWQRLAPEGDKVILCWASYDPQQDVLGPTRQAQDLALEYYAFWPLWLPTIQRFAILAGDQKGTSTLLLLDEKGNLAFTLAGLPPCVREAAPACQDLPEAALLACPNAQGGLFWLSVGPQQAQLLGVQPDQDWPSRGACGLINQTQAAFFTLEQSRLGLRTFAVPAFAKKAE